MNLIAAIGSMPYNLILAVHILAVVGAFGPTFAYASINRAARESGANGAAAVSSIAPNLQTKMSVPALIVAVLAGIGLVLLSDGAYDFSQPWISASFTVVLLLLALAIFFLAPTLKQHAALLAKPSSDDELKAVAAKLGMATGMFHLGLVVLIVLMIWKPGI